MADINNVLSIALKDFGFKNQLILLKPRFEGRTAIFPVTPEDKFLHYSASDSEGNHYSMDATDKDSDLNVLSPELLVDKAKVYKVDGGEGWASTSALVRNSDQMIIMATVEENGDINGRFNRMLTNQKAYTFNHQHDSAKSEEEFIEKVAKKLRSTGGQLHVFRCGHSPGCRDRPLPEESRQGRKPHLHPTYARSIHDLQPIERPD